MQICEKVGKSRNIVFFQWFEAPEGRKVDSLKRRVRSQLARWKKKICTPLWCEADFEVKIYKIYQLRTTFGSSDIEKMYTVITRGTFPNQNVQNTSCSRHFWNFEYRKITRCCNLKHISKSKFTKIPYIRATFEASNVASLHYTTSNYTTLHYITQHYSYTITLHYTPLHSITLNYTTPHYITLHYTTLHYTKLHYTEWQYTTDRQVDR